MTDQLTTTIQRLRMDHAGALANLRNARDLETFAKAQAEQRAIDAAGGEKALGGNAESRERALVLALAHDDTYQRAHAHLRQAEELAARLEAQLEGARDDRRAEEARICARLADALLGHNVQSDRSDPYGDGAFEDVQDHWANDALAARAHSQMLEELPF